MKTIQTNYKKTLSYAWNFKQGKNRPRVALPRNLTVTKVKPSKKGFSRKGFRPVDDSQDYVRNISIDFD
jgi:hypothetical protein